MPEPTLPAAYQAVLDAGESLIQDHPRQVTPQDIGVVAWHRLTPAQQAAELPLILAAYVHQVHEEETARRLDRDAEDVTTTYLSPGDVACAWDSAVQDPNEWDEVTTSKPTLVNLLSELELLQHRLSMRDTDILQARATALTDAAARLHALCAADGHGHDCSLMCERGSVALLLEDWAADMATDETGEDRG